MKSFFKRITPARILILLAFAVTLFVYYQNSQEIKFVQDDAYTSFRYAQNFIEGKGLVFNEGEHVEGYTNFLWVMLLGSTSYLAHALNHALNLNLDLTLLFEHLSQFLSTCFGVLLLILTYHLAKNVFSEKDIAQPQRKILPVLSSFVPLIMVLYSNPFMYWSISGMETSLFVSLTLLSILLFIKRARGKKYLNGFIIVSILNSLVRPEGMIFFGLIISFYLFQRFVNDENIRLKQRFKNLIDKEFRQITALFLLPIFCYLVFRLIYYGYPLPNTFYAKTEFSEEFLIRGLNYAATFTEIYLAYGFILLPVIVQLIRKKLDEHEKLLTWIVLAWTVLIILIGGDVLPIHRFFLPIMPLIFILVVKSSYNLLEEFSPSQFLAFTVIVVCSSLIALAVYNYDSRKSVMMEKRAYESGLVDKMKIYARWVKGNNEINVNSLPADSLAGKSMGKISVAMSTIGAFSFYSNTKVIDLVGLTDEYIAHHPLEEEGINNELPVLWKERRYNSRYIMACKPDYIIFPAGAKPSAFAECAVFIQDEFYKNYYMQIFYSKELNQLLPIFTRRENVRPDSLRICTVAFLGYYITANNLFLKMLETKNRKLLQPVLRALDKVVEKCPNREAEVNTLKGMCFYHLKSFTVAKYYLQQAAKKDSSNSIARYYLLNIFNSEGNASEAYKLIPEILKFSPDALPNMSENILLPNETYEHKKTYY